MVKAIASALFSLAVSVAAATDYGSTGFEYDGVTPPQRVAADDGTVLVDDGAFVASQSDWSEIRAYSAPDDPAPDTSAGNAYLHVDNNDPLCRKLSDSDAVEIGDGLYVDMLVRFTASDVLPDVASGDKISVWTAEDAEGTATFVVSAGYVQNSLTASMVRHYAVSAGSVVPDGEWHRLVVKSYSRVSPGSGAGANFPVFTVFIDGEPATIEGVLSFTSAGLVSIDASDKTVGPVQYFYPAVTDVALAGKLAANQLFPSWVEQLGSAPATLKRVCFVGEGDVDCYSASDTDPTPETYDTASLTIIADEGITVAPATSFTGLLPGESVSFTVTLADDYNLGGATFNGDSFAVTVGANNLSMPSPLLVSSYTLKISVARLLATVGAESYDNLRDAVDAAIASADPVVLNRDADFVNDGYFEDDVSVWIGTGNSVTVDLNGYRLRVVHGDDPDEYCDCGIFDTDGGSLTITDSSAGKTGRMTADDGLCVISTGYVSANEVLSIEAGIFDAPIFEGGMSYTKTISGGSFLKSKFTDGEGAFMYADSVVKGKTASSDGSYWTIVEGGGDPDPDDFPAEWNGGTRPSQDIVDKFSEWSKDYDWESENAQNAFLLNIAPAAVVELEPVAVVVENGVVTITTNHSLKDVNGVVYVLWGATPDNVTTPVAGTVDGAGAVTLDGTAPARFFKVGVGYAVPATN